MVFNTIDSLYFSNPGLYFWPEKLSHLKEDIKQGFLNKNPLETQSIAKQLRSIFSEIEDWKASKSFVKTHLEEIETLYAKNGRDSLLYDLIFDNDDEIVLQLIDCGLSSINSTNGYTKETPLHLCCYRGKVSLAKSLIDNHADVNALDEDPGVRSYNKNSPLGKCLEGIIAYRPMHRPCDEQIEIFKLLLQHGADPKIGRVFRCPIFTQCIRLNLEELALLIIDKVDLEEEDPTYDQRPIHAALAQNSFRIFDELMNRRVEVNSFCYEGLWSCRKITPLHIAVSKDNPQAAARLVQAGGEPNLPADNPVYGDESVQPALSAPEPLTSYMLAIDLNRKACARAIKLNFQGPFNTEFLSTRNIMFARSIDEASRKGFSTLSLRLKTEDAKQSLVTESHSLRVAIAHERFKSIAEQFLNTLQDQQSPYLANSSSIVFPIIEFIRKESQVNPELTIVFLEHDEQRGGCYNSDTGDELVITERYTRSLEELLPVFIHEATHKAAHQVYDNPRRYSQAFEKALEKDLVHLEETGYLHCHPRIKLLFDAVQSYGYYDHDAEYLARVPQAAAIIGIENPHWSEEQVKECLRKSIPALFEFFTQEFLSKIRET